jgi:ankyrin repeat protein
MYSSTMRCYCKYLAIIVATIIAIPPLAWIALVVYFKYTSPERDFVRFVTASGRTVDLFVAPEDAPLVRAVFARDAAQVKQLLASGANPNAHIEDLEFETTIPWLKPIHWAAEKGDCRSLEALIEAGADANSRDAAERTPLTCLAEVRSADALSCCVDLLCRAGADVEAVDGDGYRPLHLAAERGNTKYAQLLLDRGADVDAIDRRGCTPLVIACGCFRNTHCEAILELFARHGANPNGTSLGKVLG